MTVGPINRVRHVRAMVSFSTWGKELGDNSGVEEVVSNLQPGLGVSVVID